MVSKVAFSKSRNHPLRNIYIEDDPCVSSTPKFVVGKRELAVLVVEVCILLTIWQAIIFIGSNNFFNRTKTWKMSGQPLDLENHRLLQKFLLVVVRIYVPLARWNTQIRYYGPFASSLHMLRFIKLWFLQRIGWNLTTAYRKNRKLRLKDGQSRMAWGLVSISLNRTADGLCWQHWPKFVNHSYRKKTKRKTKRKRKRKTNGCRNNLMGYLIVLGSSL